MIHKKTPRIGRAARITPIHMHQSYCCGEHAWWLPVRDDARCSTILRVHICNVSGVALLCTLRTEVQSTQRPGPAAAAEHAWWLPVRDDAWCRPCRRAYRTRFAGRYRSVAASLSSCSRMARWVHHRAAALLLLIAAARSEVRAKHRLEFLSCTNMYGKCNEYLIPL